MQMFLEMQTKEKKVRKHSMKGRRVSYSAAISLNSKKNTQNSCKKEGVDLFKAGCKVDGVLQLSKFHSSKHYGKVYLLKHYSRK